jgi:hypothetical protein
MIWFGLCLASLVIALASVVCLFLNSKKIISIVESQNRMIRSLTNQAAAKDLAAFTAMESMTPERAIPFEPIGYVPMDDQSVVQRMAEEYSSAGVDPANAYGEHDDPLADFGGFDAFR